MKVPGKAILYPIGRGTRVAEFADLFRAHGGVGGNAIAGGEPQALGVAGFHDAGADGGGRFTGMLFGGEFAKIDGGDIDVEVDAVE